MTFGDIQFLWARGIVETLLQAGVRCFVVSPGSRSTPLVLALATTRDIVVHKILDERSAGFFAVGYAKATGQTVCLVCTSGSAPAHYLPAIVEAAHSFTPLLVLSADRPPELHGNAAPQSVNQAHLFSSFSRLFVDLGIPESGDAALRAVTRKVTQAAVAALLPEPGPVHINVPFREPLEPSAIGITSPRPAVAAAPQFVAPRSALLDTGTVKSIAQLVRSKPRGLIVAGPAPIGQSACRDVIGDLAWRTGFPLLAETASQLRFTGTRMDHRVDAFDLILRSPRARARLQPELVIQLGAPPVSKSLARMLDEAPEIRRIVIAPFGWNDPQNTASIHVRADVETVCRQISAELTVPAGTSSWAEEWSRVGEAVWQFLERGFAEAETCLSEATVARFTAGSLREDDILVVSNSLPIRDLDWFCHGESSCFRMVSQRGAAGIDGSISMALGVASAHTSRTTLLVGDSAFLHDVGALNIAAAARVPLRIVVANNNGGRIFQKLPIARREEFRELLDPWFVMPHGLDISNVAASFGVHATRVETARDLLKALTDPAPDDKPFVVEALIDPAVSKKHYGLLENASKLAADQLRDKD
ncbi:MAG TPA: 2-succinyl-5-enolpyruvyl-6-hydroxy-3-cyclohexene-1-carboxylic-acid synthase [Candidatus Latescibacteria bacterium]|nr:2-succinyl-5-enolpyruvyl-6-hydroxy-3-cyclohexene-1-carboxylic-acid synthase [Candidatus Latescibacterota bacterium]